MLRVSPWFFYYVVVRRALLDHGIESVEAADYVGALLAFHLQVRGARPRQGGSIYLIDLLREIAEARTADDAFALQTEVGDVALYLTGVFPDWVYHRQTYGRRPVSLGYYEEMGRRHYAAAAGSDVGRRHELGEPLGLLADRFVVVRQALNDLFDEHLHLAHGPESVDRLFRQALWRVRN